MKKLLKILSLAALVTVATTGCDIDAELHPPMVIDKIEILPEDWKVALAGGRFDHFYFDVGLPEIDEDVFNRGSVLTYWRYGELRDGKTVDVQELLPASISLSRLDGDNWVDYVETISCSYDVGWMRIMISRSDFFNGRPGKPLHFRTVILR
jgi:hypothetical protein